MEPEVNALSTLLSNVTTVLTSFLSWFASVSTALISNDLVMLMFGISICILIYKLGLGLVSKASFRKSRKRR